MDKLKNNRGGTARILVILSVIILILVGLLMVPRWKEFRYTSECIGCREAIKTATDALRIEYMDDFDEDSTDRAREILDDVMRVREDVCPKHGNVYLIKGDDGILFPVCGLHDQDLPRRCRLNASYALNALKEGRKKILEKAKKGDPEPEVITITTNNQPLDCTFVTEKVGIMRGTSTTKGYDGIVAFYGTNKKGKINYFVYADEDYCAIWSGDEEWSGTAYDNM